MHKPLIFLVAMMVAGASASCGTREGHLCGLKCECEGCSNHAHDACLDGYDHELKDASSRGCLEFYDDLLHCEDLTGTCDGTHWKTDCHNEKERFDKCAHGKK